MRITPRLLICCACCTLWAWPTAHATEPTLLERVGPASLRTTSAVKDNAIVLAFTDVLDLLVEVEGDADLEVRAPEAWVKGPWQARTAALAEPKKSGEKAVWTQAIRLEPLQPGELTLALEPVRYRTAGADWQTATWKPIVVRVTSKLQQPDLKNARDITAIEELPAAPPPKSQLEWIVLVAVGIPLVALLLLIWLRRRQATRRWQTPEAWAMYELERLRALQLPERGKHERFGTLLTSLVRRYLEKRFHLPARRQTTDEFVATLAGHADLLPQREFLESFLRRCDLLKFAPVTASADECRALAEQVGEFICQQQKQPATTGPKGAT